MAKQKIIKISDYNNNLIDKKTILDSFGPKMMKYVAKKFTGENKITDFMIFMETDFNKIYQPENDFGMYIVEDYAALENDLKLVIKNDKNPDELIKRLNSHKNGYIMSLKSLKRYLYDMVYLNGLIKLIYMDLVEIDKTITTEVLSKRFMKRFVKLPLGTNFNLKIKIGIEVNEAIKDKSIKELLFDK